VLSSHPETTNAPARRTLLAKLIRERNVGRQAELVHLLRQFGHPATQSSVSRDLREMGVAKVGDRYVLATERPRSEADFATVRQFVTARSTAGDHLTVLKTQIGSAPSVALAIDSARWPEVIGTISGDDTIFIATAGVNEQRRLGERLSDIFGI